LLPRGALQTGQDHGRMVLLAARGMAGAARPAR
jgi:hypothetical protein